MMILVTSIMERSVQPLAFLNKSCFAGLAGHKAILGMETQRNLECGMELRHTVTIRRIRYGLGQELIMQRERVFKKRYIIALAVIVLAWAAYMLPSRFFPVGYTLYKKMPVNDKANIYVVQTDAGATTAYSYRYYVVDAKESDADFMENVADAAPFLNTKDEKAVLSVKDSQIYLRVRGEIYSFDSPALYRSGADIYSISIHLDAAP